MALAHAARAIEEFLSASVADEGARAAATAASEFQEFESPTREAAALAPLLVAQLQDVVRALGDAGPQQRQQHRQREAAAWEFAYHESRGARAEGVAALLRLLRQQLPSAPPPQTAPVLSTAMTALVALLKRDRTYQYLAVRAFEEEAEDAGSLQGFLLHAYAARWHRGEEDNDGGGIEQQQDPSSSFLSPATTTTAAAAAAAVDDPRQQALFLRLWALLAASQPLDLPAHDLPLLARVLLGPIYRATAAPPPLSRVRRRQRRRHRPRGLDWGSPEEEGCGEEGGDDDEEDVTAAQDRHPLLVPSLELLAQAARASPAFRLCLRAANRRERNMCVAWVWLGFSSAYTCEG